MLSKAGARGPWLAAVGLFGLVSGCGSQYRPVVTPINPTGPASQPLSYFVAVSGPSPATPGLVTIIDASGDTVLAQATLGAGPFSFALNGSGTEGYNLNGNNSGAVTLNSYAISAGSAAGGGLQTRNVNSSTLAAGANPVNIVSATNSTTKTDAIYLIEPYVNFTTGAVSGQTSVAVLSSATQPPSLQEEIPVAPNPVNFAGTANGGRIFAISQSSTGAAPLAANACNTPAAVTQAGEATAIDTGTNAVSNRIPLGICPVYGILSNDNQRGFILNRGSGTVSVIQVQQNQIDGAHPSLPVGAGPVAADYYTPASLLVTANYDEGSISIIDVSLDIYGNDGPNFGQTRTVKVGNGPVAVSILQDGSRAYVANQTDGTVSVVDLTSYTVLKTIPTYHPTGQTAHPSAIASVSSTPAGKVYVVSKDSPYITVIRTDTDVVSASVLLQGNGIDVHGTSQNVAGPGNGNVVPNAVVNSRAGGLGIPCGTNGITNADPSPFCIHP